jgi:hypothetical protein
LAGAFEIFLKYELYFKHESVCGRNETELIECTDSLAQTSKLDAYHSTARGIIPLAPEHVTHIYHHHHLEIFSQKKNEF